MVYGVLDIVNQFPADSRVDHQVVHAMLRAIQVALAISIYFFQLITNQICEG